jgi:hypothetical protein
MVRRWDFSADEWACRDLLIAAFPEAVSRWTAEELEDMDTQDLLSETGEKDPEAAIDMMKLLLDTVGDKLQEREVAYQFLGWDMDGLLRDQLVQGPLLQRLKTDDHLARQMHEPAPLKFVQAVPHLLAGVLNIFFQLAEVRLPVEPLVQGSHVVVHCASPPLQQHTIPNYRENSQGF